jgi:hypothetical protein
MSEATPSETVRTAPKEVDLSTEIVESIERAVGERVTCRRIYGTKYRCNWWSPQISAKHDNPRMTGLLVTTHVVIKSRFLSVVRSEHGLIISDAPQVPSR